MASCQGVHWSSGFVYPNRDWRVFAGLYAAFAFSGSSLRRVYHLRTALERIEGAYDLCAQTLVRLLFLNFNDHLTHHRPPGLPSQDAHANVDPGETQPLRNRCVGIFKLPEPLSADPSST